MNLNLTTVTNAISGRPRCAACDRFLNFGQPVMLGMHSINGTGQQFYLCMACDAERTRDPKFGREAEARIAAHCEAASTAARVADAGAVSFDAMTPDQKVEFIRPMLNDPRFPLDRISLLVGLPVDEIVQLLKNHPAQESRS